MASLDIRHCRGMFLGFLPTILLVDVLDLGLAQWIVLRRYVTTSSNWELADGTSWAAGYVLGLLLIQALPGTIFIEFIGYLLFGVIAALVQWPVLRREIPNLLVWIVVSSLGWAAGFWTSRAVLPLFFNDPVIAVTSGLVAGIITGMALIWIVRKPELA